MIDVAVGIDGGVHGAAIHRADGGEGARAGGVAPGVYEDEAGRGANDGHVRPRVQEEDAGGDFLLLPGRTPKLPWSNVAAPGALGQVEDVAHARGTLA